MLDAKAPPATRVEAHGYIRIAFPLFPLHGDALERVRFNVFHLHITRRISYLTHSEIHSLNGGLWILIKIALHGCYTEVA